MSDTLQFCRSLTDSLLPSDHDKLKCGGHSVSDIVCRQIRELLAGIHILNASSSLCVSFAFLALFAGNCFNDFFTAKYAKSRKGPQRNFPNQGTTEVL